jgi:hypothetical protein
MVEQFREFIDHVNPRTCHLTQPAWHADVDRGASVVPAAVTSA